jgi:hypothetical protein
MTVVLSCNQYSIKSDRTLMQVNSASHIRLPPKKLSGICLISSKTADSAAGQLNVTMHQELLVQCIQLIVALRI